MGALFQIVPAPLEPDFSVIRTMFAEITLLQR